MKPYIQAVKVTDLKEGDFLVWGDEMMGANLREIESLHRDANRTYINGDTYGVPHLVNGIYKMAASYREVLRFK